MKSITSLSGGKSSSMMALRFPTDHYVFAVVLTDQQASAPKDKGLLRECQNRIPHFVASHEADLTLLNMLKLEQEIGQKIDWVAAEYSLDRFILGQTNLPGYRSGKALLPNARTRFCTIEQKLKPIFWHCYLNYWDGDPFLMNIGFRWDEPGRVAGWTCENDKFKYPRFCGVGKSSKWKYNEIEWRITQFPLFTARIDRLQVYRFWQKKGWEFPEVSNCRFCFHHTDIQQQRQAELEPENLQWWLDMESKVGATFGKRPLNEILSQPLLDVYNSQPTCHCTD